MPTYEYTCKGCGETIEVFQSFSDKPLKKHKECGGVLQMVFHARGIVFKGGGFYATDSKAAPAAESGSESASPKKSDKPAAKAPAAAKGAGTKAAAKVDLEASNRYAILFPCRRHEPNVRDFLEPVLIAACKVDLELARKVLAHRVAQKEPCNRHRVRSRVERLVGADACKVAAHDVSHGVATGFPCCQACFYQAAHDFADVFQLHPVELYVLARGDVRRAYRKCL